MRTLAILLAAPLLALGACDIKAKIDPDGGADNGTATVSIGDVDGMANAAAAPGGDRVAIDAPGFKADLRVPGLSIGGDDMDIDGLRLAPGTKVTGVNVVGDEGDKDGTVRMGLTNPQPPAAQAAYYRRAGAAAGYAVAAPAVAGGDTVLTMTRGTDKAVRFALHADGAGSAGTVTITGD